MCTHAPPTSGVSLALISSRCICQRGQCDRSALCRLFPSPIRPTHTVPILCPLLLRLFTRRHGVGSPIVAALVIRHFVGHLFHQRLILVTLTGSECALTHTSSPVKDRVSVLVQLKVERNTLVFLIYLFSIMCLCYLDAV